MVAPRTLSSPEKLTMVASPSTITASISGGPKLRANSANGGARTTNSASEMIAATNDPMAEMDNAAPALPRLAIW